MNSNSGEGYISVDGNEGDRQNLTLWGNGDDLINTVASVCNNTIVTIHSTGQVTIGEWESNPNVTAILYAGLPGQESGNAIVDVLYGRENPGGKLTSTWGRQREDYGNDLLYFMNGDIPQIQIEEGVFIDYRAFDKAGIEPIYEFGYGMSYTTFQYSDLSITPIEAGEYMPTTGQTQEAPVLGEPGQAEDYLYPEDFEPVNLFIYPYLNSTDLEESYGYTDYGNPVVPEGAYDTSPQPLHPAGGAPGGNPQLWDILYEVRATVTNTGSRDGDEVAQLYLNHGGPNQPRVVLRGFDRIHIPVGESREYVFQLTRRDVSNWSTEQQNWVITDYPKTVYVGASSRNLPLEAGLPSNLPSYDAGEGNDGDDSDDGDDGKDNGYGHGKPSYKHHGKPYYKHHNETCDDK